MEHACATFPAPSRPTAVQSLIGPDIGMRRVAAPTPGGPGDPPASPSGMMRRLAARRRWSQTLGLYGIRFPWFLCGVDFPLVHARLAGIDQRGADIVVEHRAVRLTDRTLDDGRVDGTHWAPCLSSSAYCGTSEYQECMQRTTSAMRPTVNSWRHAGQVALLARFTVEFPASARVGHGGRRRRLEGGAMWMRTVVGAVHAPIEWMEAVDVVITANAGYLMYQWADTERPKPPSSKPANGVGAHCRRRSVDRVKRGRLAHVNSAPPNAWKPRPLSTVSGTAGVRLLSLER